jgi:hypothetical protein
MSSTAPESEDDLRKLIKANSRPWNTFWSWRDKSIGEHGAAIEILQRAGVDVVDLASRPQNEDPPDCEGRLDGKWSGVEVTELVHRKTLERSIKALKQRAAGHEPEQPEAYFVWERDDLIAAIQALIDGKDVAKVKGGPYERYVLVIYTDEFFLSQEAVRKYLEGTTFRCQLITDVIIGLSHEPGFGIPTFRLEVTRE